MLRKKLFDRALMCALILCPWVRCLYAQGTWPQKKGEAYVQFQSILPSLSI